MTQVLDFIKRHTLALACGVVALIAIGALLFWIPGMIADVQSTVQTETIEPQTALETVAKQEKGVNAEMALLTHHLARNDLAASLQVVDRIQAKRATDPLPYLLRGRIERLQKNVDGARTTFAKALELQPNYFPATVELARLDVMQGKPEQAIGKIVEGRLGGFYKTVVLLDQPYAKDDKQTITQLLGPARIVRFAQVEIG